VVCLILGLSFRVLIPFQIFANLNYMMGKTLLALRHGVNANFQGSSPTMDKRFRSTGWLNSL
jgi:hypothetical protein